MGEEKLINQVDETGNMESVNEIEWIPRVGMEFTNTEEAWNFWVSYARRIGFRARKSYNNRNYLDGKTTSRAYVCGNEGFRCKDKRDHLIKRPRQETRTGCRVKLVLKLNKMTKKYEIAEFISERNHIHDLQRKVTKVGTVDVELTEFSGVLSKKAHELMGPQVSGEGNCSHTLADKSNCLSSAARCYRDLCHKFAPIAAIACTSEELYVFVNGILVELQKQVDEMILNIRNPQKSNCNTKFTPDFMDHLTQNPPSSKNGKKGEKRHTSLFENMPMNKEKKTCKKENAAQYSFKSEISSTFEKASEIPDSKFHSDAEVKCEEKSGECQQYELDSFADSMIVINFDDGCSK